MELMQLLLHRSLSAERRVAPAFFWNKMLPLAYNSTTGKFQSGQTRICIADPFVVPVPVSLTAGSGFRISCQVRDDIGDLVSDTGWQSSLALPAGTPLTLCFKRADDGKLMQRDVYQMEIAGSDSEPAAQRNENTRADIIAGAARYGVAHRGGAIGPENTLPAFEAAADNGFRYVETDVAFTKDDVPVLLHDNTINRTARMKDGTQLPDPVKIGDITYSQALGYDFGIYAGSAYAGTVIPTLPELLELCQARDLVSVTELKAAGCTEKQATLLAKAVGESGYENRVIWASFSKELLLAVREALPAAELWLVVDGVTSVNTLLANLAELGNGRNHVALDINSSSLSDALLQGCGTAGIQVHVWIVEQISALLGLPEEVGNVTTNQCWGIECLDRFRKSGAIGELLV